MTKPRFVSNKEHSERNLFKAQIISGNLNLKFKIGILVLKLRYILISCGDLISFVNRKFNFSQNGCFLLIEKEAAVVKSLVVGSVEMVHK